ncbi:ComF family protein [Microbulbifer halophilus]|uniref:Double zinc ribbon domain-containing protein n=1 Tax=Microbulbifer halophilus TaxID=453963 RepID=A0ABW5E8Q5_9GAMM|nr:ComF family protein [Microbulbifer halophilus]MCW8126140.1 ComF family protein [Microbulbifer halophilus]
MVYRQFSQFLSRSLVRCLLCGDSCPHRSGLCSGCRAELPLLHSACERCALPLPEADRTCPRCLQQPPSFAGARAAWHYAFPVGQLIQRFKYRGDLAAGHSLAQLAANRLAPRTKPDLLVPIPLHWRKFLFGRGFNQAHQIAEEFGRRWGIPVHPRLLRKVTAGETQQQLKRARRLHNLSRSFAIRGDVDGLHIGLVDDVITTGATLEAASRVLLQAGAEKVSACALARVP